MNKTKVMIVGLKMDKHAKIYIAGHRGLVGSAIVRRLTALGYRNLVVKTHSELDLTNQATVAAFFRTEQPEYVFAAAAKVGGIYANNTYPADFIYENLVIGTNLIHYAYQYAVKKLLFLGSSCIYPKLAPQPLREDALLTGALEPTNEPYALAKIAGIKMCQAYNRQYGTDFISVMPTNLYGPNDNYTLPNSHVFPALIRKFHEAKVNRQPYVELWGSGDPLREFLYADDLADACIHLMNYYDKNEIVNIGTGSDVTIRELAELIKKSIGYDGEIHWNRAMPDGTPRKLLDISKLKSLGWEPKTSLIDGIKLTYENYLFLERTGKLKK
jgi:GDP-L-fucose synthase